MFFPVLESSATGNFSRENHHTLNVIRLNIAQVRRCFLFFNSIELTNKKIYFSKHGSRPSRRLETISSLVTWVKLYAEMTKIVISL